MSRTQRLQRSQLIAFSVQNREIANERLVIQHASLPCLCELSVCQTNAASGTGGNCGHHKLPKNVRACRLARMSHPAKRMSKASARASLWIWSLQQEKLWGLTTGMNLSDFPAKFCTKLGISAVLTLTVCTRFNCGLLASVDQLTLLACNAKKAPMSISVSLSQN